MACSSLLARALVMPGEGLDQVQGLGGVGVLQVEGAQHLLVVAAPLGGGLGDHDQGVLVHDLVEQPVREGDAVQGVLEADAGEVHVGLLVAIVLVVEDVHPRELAQGVEDGLERGLVELERDGHGAAGREHGQGQGLGLAARLQGLEVREALLLVVAPADPLLHDGEVVAGRLVAAVVLDGDVQLVHRPVEVLGGHGLARLRVVEAAGLDASVLERDLVADVVGGLLERDGEPGHRHVPVALLRLAQALAIGLAGRAARQQQPEGERRHERGDAPLFPHLPHHSL